AASTCRRASASSWRWPAPTWPTRRASCSTKPPVQSIQPPRHAWRGHSRACRMGARRSPSPTGWRRRPPPPRGWGSMADGGGGGAEGVLVFEAGRLVEQGRHDDLVHRGGVYAGLHASWLDATAAGVATESAVTGA